MGARLPGILLFLPVPAVLVLFTRLPLGALPSLGLGIVLMATHRLYARPFALSRAGKRCLYCGGDALQGPEVPIQEPFGVATWRACREVHAARLQSVLSWSAAHRVLLRVGILGGTVLLLALVPLADGSALGGVRPADVIAAYRVLIGVLVLALASLGPGFPPSPNPAVPFPVHIQALLGTVVVLWLFRIVGVVWLVLGVLRIGGRLLGG